MDGEGAPDTGETVFLPRLVFAVRTLQVNVGNVGEKPVILLNRTRSAERHGTVHFIGLPLYQNSERMRTHKCGIAYIYNTT